MTDLQTFRNEQRNCDKYVNNLLGKLEKDTKMYEYPSDYFLSSRLKIKKITDKEVFIWTQIKDFSIIIPKMPNKVVELMAFSTR